MSARNFLVILFGLVALVRPNVIANLWNGPRAQRLEQLKAGAEERYFEERRQLEAYPIRHLWTVRLLGAFALLASVGPLFL
jgi:hypothetical protein